VTAAQLLLYSFSFCRLLLRSSSDGSTTSSLLFFILQAAAALEQLESYPHEPEVHAYLLDRLTRVAGLEALYELHYLAITLGKVGLYGRVWYITVVACWVWVLLG
jgi:hypothetical protein